MVSRSVAASELTAGRSGAIPLVAAGGLLLLLIVVVGGLAGGVALMGSVAEPSGAASAEAIAGIPADYLALYQRAAGAYGIDWAILAAIGKIECDHGRSQSVGCNPPGTVNGAGAT